MKRPIVELLGVTLLPEAETTERTPYDQDAWQILRRKQGYVTHRVYQHATDARQRLIYSEWESKKALDGARHHLQTTPLLRRARALLVAPPQRLVVELSGPVTSTKGMTLPEPALAAVGTTRAADASVWHDQEEALSKLHASQPGHLAHVLFHGFEDAAFVGAMSHWADAAAFAAARAHFAGEQTSGRVAEVLRALTYVEYRPLPD